MTCTDPSDATVWHSSDNSYDLWEEGLREDFNTHFPFAADKLDVKSCHRSDCEYPENCRCLVLEFKNVIGDVPQCTIDSSVANPTADPVIAEITGEGTPTFDETTLRQGGVNLVFEPIPLEMLRTSVTKPQVEVTVSTIPAICENFDCEY